MSRRTTISVVLGLVSIACAVGVVGPVASPGPAAPRVTSEPLPAGTEGSQIVGVLTEEGTEAPLAGAIVVIQCACLAGNRETESNNDGLFAFRNLPPGEYTVQILYRHADVAERVILEAGSRVKVRATIDGRARIIT